LHGNSRCSTDRAFVIVHQVVDDALHLGPIHTPVTAKPGILRRQNRSRQVGRHLVEADPLFADAVAVEGAKQHQVADRRRHHGINKCEDKGCDNNDGQKPETALWPEAQRFPAGFKVEGHQLRFGCFVDKEVVNKGYMPLVRVTPQEFEHSLKNVAGQTDDVLGRLLLGRPGDRLRDAMRYAVLGQGKRLRPFLVVQSAQLFGVDAEQAYRTGAALEAVHCYSLVHDDLPAMDNDDLRRGQATTHRKFDEATAILAGDALLTFAFEVLADSATHADPAIRVALVGALAKAAGEAGMVGGQMLDIEADRLGFDNYGQISAMQARKTGALFGFACEAGAILGAADASPLRQYAEHIGLAFQIADDVLDIESSAETMGKATQKDKGKGKATFVDLLGLEGAKLEARRLVDAASGALECYGARAEMLKAAARFIVERRK
jgi:farnesyl diphosphate synthase